MTERSDALLWQSFPDPKWQSFPDPKAKIKDRYRVLDVRPGFCFGNAYRLTRMFRELTYVEGCAYSYDDIDEVKLKHAWCITPDGEVVDVTWNNEGFAYEGIVFPGAVINRVALETGFWTETALDWLRAAA